VHFSLFNTFAPLLSSESAVSLLLSSLLLDDDDFKSEFESNLRVPVYVCVCVCVCVLQVS